MFSAAKVAFSFVFIKKKQFFCVLTFDFLDSAEEIGEMLKGQFQKSKLSTSTKRKRISPTKDIKNIPPADQLSFFDWGEGK